MPKTALLSVDGSVMVAVPVAYLERTGLGASSSVEWAIDGDRLVLRPDTQAPEPHYTLDQLLAECDPSASVSEEDSEWTGGGPVGRELI